MQIFLDKFLAIFAFPLGSSLVLLLVALAARARGRARAGTVLTALATAWLWLCATPLVAGALTESLEGPWPSVPVEALPEADLVVVLGGGLMPPATAGAHPDLGESADRYWHAARIHRAGRAPRILVSGGDVWGTGRQTEAEAVAGFLRDLGVPPGAILEERSSRNTWENARHTGALLAERGWNRVLLVTSARHMGRARAAFARAGVETIPAATDHAVPGAAPALFGVLPDADALKRTTSALREYLGRLVYRLRGWI